MGQGPSSPSSPSSSCSEVKRTSGAGDAATRCRDLTLFLPEECLACVFASLPANDRNSCSLVCRRWRSVDAGTRHRLSLTARSEISAALPGLLGRFSSVSALSLKCSRKLVSIDDRALALIPSRLGCLRKLMLKGCVDVSDDGLRAFSLSSPPLLQKVSFASCGFGGRGIMSLLCNCPSLRDLTLKRLRKLDAESTPLSMNSYLGEKEPPENLRLESLCIKDLHNARIFIPLLQSCKFLKALVVCRSSGNWDRVILDSLLSESRPTMISEIQMENVQMGDSGLTAISASCPELQVLFLSRVTDCTDDGLSSIAASCRNLRKLHVDAWTRFGARSIGDEGITVLGSKCSNLQDLVLMGIPVKFNSLNALASNCLSLERMAICNTESVGDTEMEVIAARFSALKKLCIKNCPVSLKGVEALVRGCPGLIKLKVKRCRGVSQESVSHFGAWRGDLVISVDSDPVVVEGEGPADEEDGLARGEGRDGAGWRRPAAASALLDNGARVRTNRSTTHVICSSRGAQLLRSKFGKTSSTCGGCSAHAPTR